MTWNCGYDVIDFYKVDPRFGTNDDVVKLVEKAHSKGIRVVLDLVAGHSSIDCAWFKRASPPHPFQQSYTKSNKSAMKKTISFFVLIFLISLSAFAQESQSQRPRMQLPPSSPQNAIKFIWGDQNTNNFVGRIVYGAYAEANAAAGDADVVFIGDSITQNWYMFHHSFFDDNGFLARGISGQTSIEILCRFQQDVVAHHPKVVVMMIGTNDVARNAGIISDECYLSNIASCCDIAKANGIKMLLCSIPPCDKFSWNQDITPGPEIIRLNEKLMAYAAENGIRYVDFFSALSNGNDGMIDEYTSDRCHPTPAGYDVMERIILEDIGKALDKD